MDFTNKHKIESASVRDALKGDDYDLQNKPRNVFSCTEIIDAPKEKQLSQRHADEIVVDYSDNFWKLDGSAVHFSIEMANLKSDKERLSEERIYIAFSSLFVSDISLVKAHTLAKGARITDAPWYNEKHFYVSVKFDNYEADGGVVEDYKRTSAWEAVFGIKKSRTEQLNIGAYGMRLIGFATKKLRACLFIKDWSKKERDSAVQRNSYYPPIPYREFNCPLWNDETAFNFILARLKLHVGAQQMKDDEIPECNSEERWYRGEELAVMKQGAKRATRVFKISNGNRAEQEKLASQCVETLRRDDQKNASKYSIQKRPGRDVRCLDYCKCKEFCHYYNNVHKIKTEVFVDESTYGGDF